MSTSKKHPQTPIRTRNPERVRERVLDASTRLFAAMGFAGTSLRNISDASGVSVGLIQYHFGTKQALYDAVREHALAAYVQSQAPQFALPEDDIGHFLADGLRQYFRFCEQNPLLLRLFAWAQLESDARIWSGELTLMDRVMERLEAAQRAGTLDGDVDPELLMVALGGMMRYWPVYRARYAARLEHLGDAQAQEEAYLTLCLSLVRGSTPK